MAWTQDRKRQSVGSLKPKYDSDGKIWLYGYSLGAATRKTLGRLWIGTYGWNFVTAVADPSDVVKLGFIAAPKATYTSGVYGWFQIGGICSDAIMTTTTGTVGHGVEIVSDTIVSAGAANSGQDHQFAVMITAKTTSNSQDILMFPEKVDGQDAIAGE